MTPSESEATRILAEYKRREREIGRDHYSLLHTSNLFFSHGQQRALQRALVRSSTLPLADRRILEIGCGLGRWLSIFEAFGAKREKLAGIDLDRDRIEETREHFQTADLRVGDACQLPWPDHSFDVVFQSLVFTSILDDSVRQGVAREMLRVVASDGVILWYDFRFNNPNNSNVRAVSHSDIRRLFPGCSVELERVTLAPPISRRLVPISWLTAALLERVRLLNTHYFGVIRPR